MVSNVVTIDAPHGGVLARPYNFCVNSYLPCTEGYEMTANYPFMNDMYKYAQSPQGQGGTMWMLMGSACAVFSCGNEGIEPFLNSRYMANAWKKVWYTCSDGLTCYDHGSFLTDSSRNWETNVKFCSYCQAGDDGPKDTHNMPRSLYMMKYGLLGIDPRDDPYRGVLSTNPKPTPTPTLTPTPAAKPTMSVPAGSGLNLEEGVPFCDVATDPEIATWQEGSTGSHLICTPAPDNEGQVAQMMPVNANQLAEMDLQSINGASYGLTTFAVSMNVDPFALTNGGADSDVYVGFNVATPLHGCGGTIFALNAQWQWILERVSSCSQITTLQQGQVAQSAWTNSAPRISITLTLDNQLRASVNGTPIVSVDNVQVSDPVIGLVAQAVPGSNVGWTQYTNLSLQTDNCFLAHQCTDVIAPTP